MAYSLRDIILLDGQVCFAIVSLGREWMDLAFVCTVFFIGELTSYLCVYRRLLSHRKTLVPMVKGHVIGALVITATSLVFIAWQKLSFGEVYTISLLFPVGAWFGISLYLFLYLAATQSRTEM